MKKSLKMKQEQDHFRMKRYVLAGLSRYNHQEGYIETVLWDLVLSGKATYGLIPVKDGSLIWGASPNRHFIKITYSYNDNPVILFKGIDFGKVVSELERRVVNMEIFKTSDYIHELINDIDNPQLQEALEVKANQNLLNITQLKRNN